MSLCLIQTQLQEAGTSQHGLRGSHHALWVYPFSMYTFWLPFHIILK